MVRRNKTNLSDAQKAATDFFYENNGKWFSGTDIHDKAYHIKMNTVYSLVKLGWLVERERYHTEYSFNSTGDNK